MEEVRIPKILAKRYVEMARTSVIMNAMMEICKTSMVATALVGLKNFGRVLLGLEPKPVFATNTHLISFTLLV